MPPASTHWCCWSARAAIAACLRCSAASAAWRPAHTFGTYFHAATAASTRAISRQYLSTNPPAAVCRSTGRRYPPVDLINERGEYGDQVTGAVERHVQAVPSVAVVDLVDRDAGSVAGAFSTTSVDAVARRPHRVVSARHPCGGE